MIRSGDHDFKDGTATDPCIHCGTTYQLHQHKPQPCVPHRTAERVMPEPARRVYAVEDYDTIGARIEELKNEHVQG